MQRRYHENDITTKCYKIACYLHSEAASNLSDFFFRFHFQGLKSLPRAENLLFLSKGGVLAPEPKLFVRKAAPFCFFAATKKDNFTLICIRHIAREIYEMGLRDRVRIMTHVGHAFSYSQTIRDQLKFIHRNYATYEDTCYQLRIRYPVLPLFQQNERARSFLCYPRLPTRATAFQPSYPCLQGWKRVNDCRSSARFTSIKFLFNFYFDETSLHRTYRVY